MKSLTPVEEIFEETTPQIHETLNMFFEAHDDVVTCSMYRTIQLIDTNEHCVSEETSGTDLEITLINWIFENIFLVTSNVKCGVCQKTMNLYFYYFKERSYFYDSSTGQVVHLYQKLSDKTLGLGHCKCTLVEVLANRCSIVNIREETPSSMIEKWKTQPELFHVIQTGFNFMCDPLFIIVMLLIFILTIYDLIDKFNILISVLHTIWLFLIFTKFCQYLADVHRSLRVFWCYWKFWHASNQEVILKAFKKELENDGFIENAMFIEDITEQ